MAKLTLVPGWILVAIALLCLLTGVCLLWVGASMLLGRWIGV